MDCYEIITKELYNKKSISALIYLISNGRELEFKVDGKDCFLSCDKAEKYVSVWVCGSEQSFRSMEELIDNAVIENSDFISVWERADLGTLF